MKTKGAAKDDGDQVAGVEGPERTVQFTKGVERERGQRHTQVAKAMKSAKGGRLAGIKAACMRMRR